MKDILKKEKMKGFTLAEVLITLVIIGVVTALTIPSLLANINDKTYDSKRKGFATRMAQAIAQIGTLNAYEAEGDINAKEENSSMNFIVEALSKVYSITQVCEFENFAACDFADSFNFIWGGSDRSANKVSTHAEWTGLNPNATADKLGGLNTKGAVFRTKNGESVILWYNPRCIPEQEITPTTVTDVGTGEKNFAKEVCINMLYDLDGGKKGPNRMGKDMGFAIVLYPDTPYLVVTDGTTDSVHTISPNYPSYKKDADIESKDTADGYCRNEFTPNYGYKAGQFTLASREEIYAAAINYNLQFYTVRYQPNSYQWSSTVEGPTEDDYGWQVQISQLTTKLATRNTPAQPRCILDFGI